MKDINDFPYMGCQKFDECYNSDHVIVLYVFFGIYEN